MIYYQVLPSNLEWRKNSNLKISIAMDIVKDQINLSNMLVKINTNADRDSVALILEKQYSHIYLH